jgi:general secretion pathway protein G
MQTLRNRLARSYARAHRGMTLLEIMIVLAIIALVMGLLVGPRVMKLFGQSKVDITKLKLNQYANEAFPSWSTNHPDKACPEKLSDLNEYMNNNDANDAWGRPMKLLCPPPPGVKGGLGVTSMGEDGKEGTPDDLKSWGE